MHITQDPSSKDAGKYKCVATNEFGEATANVNLNIESEPEPPEPTGKAPMFVEKPVIKWEDGANRVIMEALVKADPKPTSKWTKEGVSVEGSSKCTTSITKVKEKHFRIRLELRVHCILTWKLNYNNEAKTNRNILKNLPNSLQLLK